MFFSHELQAPQICYLVLKNFILPAWPDQRQGRIFSLFIDRKDTMEDLHRLVGIHCRTNPCDDVEIPVNEFTESLIVVSFLGIGFLEVKY